MIKVEYIVLKNAIVQIKFSLGVGIIVRGVGIIVRSLPSYLHLVVNGSVLKLFARIYTSSMNKQKLCINTPGLIL